MTKQQKKQISDAIKEVQNTFDSIIYARTGIKPTRAVTRVIDELERLR